jgi:DeoR/GlpR family transcriptional regulator of sugar metabolism
MTDRQKRILEIVSGQGRVEAARLAGEAVMIESGSCRAILAEELVLNRRDVRIITNSAFIAAYIRRLPRARIVLLGGDYQSESQVMVGPITRLCVQTFTVDKLFIGAGGFAETQDDIGLVQQPGWLPRTKVRTSPAVFQAKALQNRIF